MKAVDLDERAGGGRAKAVARLRMLADRMEAGELTDVLYATRAPDRHVDFGLATVYGLLGLESAGMAVWLLHWIQNEAEYDD